MSKASDIAAPATVQQEDKSGDKASKTYFQAMVARFLRHRLAVAGLLVLMCIGTVVLLAPWIAPHDPYETDYAAFSAPPSSAHPLGTDSIGRDVLARLLYGGRVSLSVGLVATSIGVLIGVPLGLLAGFRGGIVDAFIMRTADTFMSVPAIMLILVLVAVIGPNIWSVMFVLGVLGWPHFARLIRGGVLVTREREFVQAAHVIGASNLTIMFKHILPNAIAPVLVAATFRMAQAILLEASLSFLGMGVQPPQASWGNMLHDAQSITTLSQMPWMWVPPGLAIIISVLAINFVGDGLRDALDPKMKL